MRRPGIVRVRAVGKRTVEFDGCRWTVRDAGQRLQLKTFMRAPHGIQWHCRDDEANDLIAYLEDRGHRIEMRLL